MSKYTYFEVKDKMTELEFTSELFGYISNAKREVDYALSFNRGILDEDDEFKKKLRAVFHELDELNSIVIKAYNKEREKFVRELTKQENE